MIRIIVATDFSPASKHAIAYAFKAFDTSQVEFTLLNVVHIDGPPPPFMFNRLVDSLKIRAQYKYEAMLAELSKPQNAQIQKIRIEYGSPIHSVIEKVAREENADLIIAGAGTIQNLEQMVLGDVATNLVSHSAFPVIIVPLKAPVKPIEKIVNATGIEQTETDFLKIMQFAANIQAQVTMLHVYNSMDRTDTMQAKTIQEIAASKYGFKNVSFAYEISPSAVTGIIKHLQKTNPDLLAVFPHKKLYLDRIFSHRVTRELASKAAVPMLIIKD